MINKQALFDVIKYNHYTLPELDYIMNLEEGEFKKKLKLGIFQTNEVEMMLHFLEFPVEPWPIFFDTYDPEKPEKIDWGRALLFPKQGVVHVDNDYNPNGESEETENSDE